MWELYVHAFLKQLDADINFSHNTPDFVAKLSVDIIIEATIAAPPQRGIAPSAHK